MSNRIDTPFTNEHFAAYCMKMVGQPYWYGCCGYKATSDLLSRKAKQYPSHYTSNRTARYKQDIAAKKVVCDCIGGSKGYAWSGGGQSMLDAIGSDKPVSSKYGSNGCPDKGANSMFSYAKQKGMANGAIGTLPEIVGIVLCPGMSATMSAITRGEAVSPMGWVKPRSPVAVDELVQATVHPGQRCRLDRAGCEIPMERLMSSPTPSLIPQPSYKLIMMRGEDVRALQNN